MLKSSKWLQKCIIIPKKKQLLKNCNYILLNKVCSNPAVVFLAGIASARVTSALIASAWIVPAWVAFVRVTPAKVAPAWVAFARVTPAWVVLARVAPAWVQLVLLFSRCSEFSTTIIT